uniref:RBR-type E3 ubiquitin transferase n=1 Tax=Myripristis murdjan TaxID=586833 RepID=A0A667XHA5_9TELE
MSADLQEQEDELLVLHSIFSPDEFVREEPKCDGEIRVSVELPKDFCDGLRQYEISFLPPLLLTFELPEDYPSSSPPSFTLTCSWLTHTQLSTLSAHLVDLYQATGGTVVLFSWVQFLREEALSFLDIHSLLELPSDEHNSQSGQTGADQAASLPDLLSPKISCQEKDRALSRLPATRAQTLLSQLLVYDEAQKQKVFSTTLFDCGVCFVTWPGSECMKLSECDHVYCQPCLAQFCKVQIEEGNIRSVSCPQSDCSATPTPAQVKRLVGEELFSRYDRLLLQSTLDHMPDVVYCPRRSCGCAVILEAGSRAALCSVCGFAFCVACRKTYHGADDSGLMALWDDYARGSKMRRGLLESRYGRHRLRSTVTDCLSENWVATNSKHCPRCFYKIEKDGGCNMMTCSHCGQRFCWACLAKLSEHFNAATVCL